MSGTTRDIPALAVRFLVKTDSPAGWMRYWRERNWCRALLARCHAPRYRLRLQAEDDLETMTALLATVEGGRV